MSLVIILNFYFEVHWSIPDTIMLLIAMTNFNQSFMEVVIKKKKMIKKSPSEVFL